MQVVNVKKQYLKMNGYNDLVHWLSNKNHVYIGRDMTLYVPGAVGSKWKNPFSAKKYGLDKCLQLYEEHLLSNKDLMKSLPELKGKILGCWCKPNKCHGDILMKYINMV